MTLKEDFSKNSSEKKKIIIVSSFLREGVLYSENLNEINNLLNQGWEIQGQENITPNTVSYSLVMFTLKKGE